MMEPRWPLGVKQPSGAFLDKYHHPPLPLYLAPGQGAQAGGRSRGRCLGDPEELVKRRILGWILGWMA